VAKAIRMVLATERRPQGTKGTVDADGRRGSQIRTWQVRPGDTDRICQRMRERSWPAIKERSHAQHHLITATRCHQRGQRGDVDGKSSCCWVKAFSLRAIADALASIPPPRLRNRSGGRRVEEDRDDGIPFVEYVNRPHPKRVEIEQRCTQYQPWFSGSRRLYHHSNMAGSLLQRCVN